MPGEEEKVVRKHWSRWRAKRHANKINNLIYMVLFYGEDAKARAVADLYFDHGLTAHRTLEATFFRSGRFCWEVVARLLPDDS
jgi:hypothetical protein